MFDYFLLYSVINVEKLNVFLDKLIVFVVILNDYLVKLLDLSVIKFYIFCINLLVNDKILLIMV